MKEGKRFMEVKFSSDVLYYEKKYYKCMLIDGERHGCMEKRE